APVEPLGSRYGFGYGSNTPTGRFSPGAKENIGFGFWMQQLQLAAALNFDDASLSFTLERSEGEGQSALEDQSSDEWGDLFAMKFSVQRCHSAMTHPKSVLITHFLLTW